MRRTPPTPDSRSKDPRGDATREALVLAGIELFAKVGYHAASSRALAEAAGANQALIGYHFGGKQGLYMAVFQHIGEAIGSRLGPAGAELQQKLDAMGGRIDRAALIDGLLNLIDRAVDLFTSPETATWAMLIVREQQNPGPAFDRVWNRFMSPLAGVLCRVVGALRGEPDEDPQVRLTAVTIIAQPLGFRVARETTLRLLGWEELGPGEIAAIKRRIHHNLLAMLAQENRP